MKSGTGRQALIDAVIEVVGTRGLGGATNREIARHAGVDNTLITHHFGTRQALLEAAMEYSVERSLSAANAAGPERLDGTFVEGILALVRAEPNLQEFQFEMILAVKRMPQIRGPVAKLYDSYLATFEEMLEAYGLPRDPALARAIFACVESLVLQGVSGTAQDTDIKAALSRMHSMLLAATGAVSPPVVHTTSKRA